MNVIYSGQKTFIKYVNLIILNMQEFLKGQFTQKWHCHNSLTLISFLDLDISVVVWSTIKYFILYSEESYAVQNNMYVSN